MYAAGNHRILMNVLRLNHRMCCITRMKSLEAFQAVMYKNPGSNFEEHLDLSVSELEENYFKPSIKSMQSSQELFLPNEQHIIHRISRKYNEKRFPRHNLPEVTFLGRANAGKSALINAILPTIPDMKIKCSKEPGLTKCLHFYRIGNNFCLVDTPGYAHGSIISYEKSVIYYLKHRKNLIKTFLLVDTTEGFQPWDDGAMKVLGDLKIPFAIILTKIDAISHNERSKHFLHVHDIRNEYQLNTCFPQIFMVSARTFEGMAYLKAFLAHVTGNLKFETP